MEKEKNSKGSAAVAFILGLFLVVFALVTLYLFVDSPRLGWWPPAPITSFGHEVDRQFFRTYVIVGAIFVLCQIALGWIVFRFRDRGGRARYSHGNQTMEVLWTLATLVLFFGLDPNDPAGKDDLVTPVIAVPVNREVELLIRSKDVTHSFFVRELRLKQDAVPGMLIPIHFTATKIGTYEIACAELCGLGHHQMRSFLQVMAEADYQKWLAEQAANQ